MAENDPPNRLQKVDEGQVLASEIAEAVKREAGGQININILLQQVTEKEKNPDRALEHADALIRLSERYEDHRIKTFQARTQAIIDAKANDPDEIEKRSNNRVRRQLKAVIAGCAITGIGGAIVSAVIGASMVVTGLMASVGVVSIAMLGPLASGESISSTDVVRMVNAIGDLVGKAGRSGNDQVRRSNGKRK